MTFCKKVALDCEKCCICLEEFALNDTMELKCGHVFHTECLFEALQKSHAKCALCRSAIDFPNDDAMSRPLTCAAMMLIMFARS